MARQRGLFPSFALLHRVRVKRSRSFTVQTTPLSYDNRRAVTMIRSNRIDIQPVRETISERHLDWHPLRSEQIGQRLIEQVPASVCGSTHRIRESVSKRIIAMSPASAGRQPHDDLCKNRGFASTAFGILAKEENSSTIRPIIATCRTIGGSVHCAKISDRLLHFKWQVICV